ncbi:MAG: BrnT family toxin [Gammaproteobacteria bacterium]|nr:BrnT family toxin [Gammaproteobacteria bacterium]
MRFDWDDEKNERNIRNHKIDFEDAQNIFHSPMIIRLDNRKDYGEDRWIGTGFLGNLIVVAVYSAPDNDTTRLISARKANQHERKRFEKEISNRLG